MKKSLFFALIACAALVFVGCDEKVDPNQLTGITVAPNELSLTPGEEFRLSVLPTPSTAVLEGTATWASSDTTVAVVNENGVVTAVNYGKANITVTVGEYTAACAVWVKTYHESLVFTNAVVWNVDTTFYGDSVYSITTSDETETFNCYLAQAELWLCADGFFINESGYLDGGDYASYITVYAPMYYGTKYLNPEKGGVQFVLGEWGLAAIDSIAAHIGAPGVVNEEVYLTYMDYALQSYNAGDGQMFATYLLLAGGYVHPELPVALSGATLSTMEYNVDETTGEGGYYSSYIPDGIVTEGMFSLNGDGISVFMCGMDYNYLKFRPIANDATYAWGCNWLFNEDGSQIAWGEETPVLHWGEEITYQYGEMPTEEAPAMKPLFAPVMKIDYPEVAERIEKQIKENTSLKIKK